MSNFTLMPWAPSQWTDSLGNILEFGIIRFYEAGTLIPKTTYKKADGSEANTNPLILDPAGRARVWLTNDEAYDIIVHNKNDELEYSILDVLVSSGGSGGGTSVDRKVAADDIDMVPGVLVDKMRSSSSVTIIVVDVGGRKLQFSVDETWLGNWLTVNYPFPADDHLVISDGTMQTAGTLAQKVTDALGTVFAVNGAKQLVIPLQERLSLVDGGHVTGLTIFDDVTFPDQFKVKASSTDSVPGFLGVKFQPGAGMRLDSTIDPDLGEIISISMINIPTPVAIPAKRVVLGSGSGVTSDALLTYDNKQLTAAAAAIATFYLGLGSYAAFKNVEVGAVPTRNFKDGITQYADGTIRIGADGDEYAIKLSPVTKEIRTGADGSFVIGGKMFDAGGEITAATYTLPVVAAGETRTIRFNGAAGCTIVADSAQIPRYRNTINGLSTVGTAGGQVDATAVFGVVAGCKVAAITIKGISATACQVVY